MAMPKTVPVLTDKDMCRLTLNNVGLHCLIGWCEFIFPEGKPRSSAVKAVRRSVLIHMSRDKGKYTFDERNQLFGPNIAWFNDSRKNSFDLLSRIWNRAMYYLDYDVKKVDR